VNAVTDASWVDPLIIFGVLLAVRLAWMFTIPHLFVRWRDVAPWQDRFILGWSGMRGALSLAAALSIPTAVAQRNEVLYLTFITILAGLVVLAVPLPWLLDVLGFPPGAADEADARERLRLLDALDERRAELARMERAGEVSHTAARRIELDLDLEETVLSRR
jgi:CPA1 family monovalent cation:H+ antiporter